METVQSFAVFSSFENCVRFEFGSDISNGEWLLGEVLIQIKLIGNSGGAATNQS